LAFQSYRLSRGKSWLLVLILMFVTALASALLDNFTTMLLMVPISLQIALAIGLNPAALIIPEILASNVGGISTLIGTPTNILIGAYAGIGFSDFLVNQTVGVVLALLVMAAIVLYVYRTELHKSTGGISPALYQKLAENGRIRQPDVLLKSGIVFVATLALFIIGERYQMEPAVAAMAGAAAILLWVRPNVNDKIREVDWTTLVFFMALFIMVGAIQEVGLLDRIGLGLAWVIGGNLALAIIVIVFGVGGLSLLIANIPLAAAMLPVVSALSATIPGAGDALYYALSMGAAMGGNGFIISGEANIVTAGISQRAGSPIAFREFARVGLPVTFATMIVGALWLLFRFVLLT
jgi:Na+/H+ antiporter NhaD/arsenite permease-like protein